MSDKVCLKKAMYTFHRESSRLLGSNWSESPQPIRRFLEQIELIDEVDRYLSDCVSNHTPGGFSASEDFDAVANDYSATFGPFSTIPEEESAQVYLILKEIVTHNVGGYSGIYHGYGGGSKNLADKYKGFLDSVARRLIDNIDHHLALIGIDMGLDDSNITNTFNAPVGSAQINQATGGSTVQAVQTNGMQPDKLNSLLNAILESASSEFADDGVLADIRDNVAGIREQMTCDEPKCGLVKGSLAFLRSLSSGTQFAAAVAQLADFLSRYGITLPS